MTSKLNEKYINDGWLVPSSLFDGQNLLYTAAVRIENGTVVEIKSVAQVPKGAMRTEVSGLLTPGFVDLQVNGGGGVLINQSPTRAGMRAVAQAHRQFGTVALMPTVITDAPEVLQAAVAAALEAKDDRGIAGLHIEGPHIAAVRRGTHAKKFIGPMDETTVALVRELRAAGIKVLITVAPESTTSAQIAELAETGAVVSLGHSDATAEIAHEAFGAGARCVTHLYNAMSPMLSRAPGLVGTAINSDAYTGIICDGIHVADQMVGLAIRARPVPDRMFLVSDAMPTVGGPDHFDLYGSTIRLEDGRLINAQGTLAGAHVTQLQGVARLVQNVGIDLEQALRMAITVPSMLIGADHLATVVGRSVEDILVLNDDLSLKSVGPMI